MRRSVPLAPIQLDRWEPAGAAGVEMVTLNQDLDSGARTALIRSVPRDGVERKSHFHHCEEEFLCLAGRFSFDGRHWMQPLSYACYPSHFIHGTRVSVPGGYLLYLRTSGSTQAFVASEPVTIETSKQVMPPDAEPILAAEHAFEPFREGPTRQSAPERIRRRSLRSQPQINAEVTLWEFGDNAGEMFQHFPDATPLEVLIFRAGPEAVDGTDSLVLAYGYFAPGDVRPALETEGLAFALVHSGGWA